MSERSRNVAVGVTVVVALALLGGLILIFAGLPTLFKGGYGVGILLDSSYELAAGDPVYLSGIRVGAIDTIGFADPESPGMGVLVRAKINEDIRLPGNVKPVVYTRGFTGKGYLQLNPEGPYPVDEQGHLVRFVPTTGDIVLLGEGRGSGLIPDDFRVAIQNIAKLADNLNRLVAPVEPSTAPATGPQTGPATTPADISLASTVVRLNRALDSITAVTGDPQNQQNIRSMLANLSVAAEEASAAMVSLRAFADQARQTTSSTSQHIDELMSALVTDAEAFSQLTASINRVVMKVDAGEGTVGQLVNDPQLYNNLTQATTQLNGLVRQMQLMVESWTREGVEVKLR